MFFETNPDADPGCGQCRGWRVRLGHAPGFGLKHCPFEQENPVSCEPFQREAEVREVETHIGKGKTRQARPAKNRRRAYSSDSGSSHPPALLAGRAQRQMGRLHRGRSPQVSGGQRLAKQDRPRLTSPHPIGPWSESRPSAESRKRNDEHSRNTLHEFHPGGTSRASRCLSDRQSAAAINLRRVEIEVPGRYLIVIKGRLRIFAV